MTLSENSKRVAALMEEGKDPAAIAKALPMSMEDVHEHRSLVFAEMDAHAREEGLLKPDGRKKVKHYRRTTDDELLDLAELLGAGYCQARIAEDMGRSTAWVSMHKEQALELRRKAQALELWYAKRGEEQARQTLPAPVAESRQEEPQKRANPFAEIGAAFREAFGFLEEQPEEQPEEPDMVNHPPHYKQGRFECFDVIVALLGVEGAKAFCKGNIIKYRYRAAAKNGAEDIAKADRYMEMLKELEGGEYNAAD